MLYSIEVYETATKKRPFSNWLDKQESGLRNTIRAKLDRISLGNFSSCKLLGDKISEIKLNIGPGYRIYYSVVGKKIILLLCAGDKGSQQKDIEKAKDYLNDYIKRGREHGKK